MICWLRTVWFQHWPKERTSNFAGRKNYMIKSLYTDEYVCFRKLLRRARKDAGLTQTELAERLNKPQSYIYKNESGERRVDITEYLDIMYVLGKDPHEILDELGKMYK